MTSKDSPVPYSHFAKQVKDGMRRSGVTVTAITEECGVSRETVRLWRKGVSVPRDKSLRKLAKMIGVDVAALRFEGDRPAALPRVQGEHVTDEDELALLIAYRGLRKNWAREALRRRAVELLEEFGDKGAANPWAKVKPPGTN